MRRRGGRAVCRVCCTRSARVIRCLDCGHEMTQPFRYDQTGPLGICEACGSDVLTVARFIRTRIQPKPKW